ncbi:alpha/beta hydrolase [Kineococcus sp. SYSU DK018]|uniref:hypothetical protein n=1 Tax=Kineococcus sp. SYSU DK018 TaxID=3383139 RepID=UPI003D7C4E56
MLTGSTVLAPGNEKLDPRAVTAERLRERVQTLKAALAHCRYADLPVIAIGHSIGGCAALCLAGAQPRDRDGRPVPVPVEERVKRLVLLAPAVGWFQAPRALSQVRVPASVFVGGEDVVTPPAGIEILRSAPGPVGVRLHEHAEHFDYMTELPPGATPTPGLDRAAFLRGVALGITAALR